MPGTWPRAGRPPQRRPRLRGGAGMSEAVLTEDSGGVAVITITRPQARNAVNGEVARGIAAAVSEYDSRADVSVLILTGAGGTFSAGMDLKGFLAGDGLVAGAGGLLRLPRRIPYHLAMEVALTGAHFAAARLAEAGLVNRLVPAGQALAAARELASQGALGAPLALAATKRVIAESADWPASAAV